MFPVWIAFTFLAAFMQAIRTAGQKKLASHIDPMTTTLVRYLFGLPFALMYLWFINDQQPLLDVIKQTIVRPHFLIYASLAGVAQILATFWLVKVLTFRNFAVGTAFAKTEAIQTAILGVVLFHTLLSFSGWIAVCLGVIGIIMMSLPKKGQPIEAKTIFYGLMSGIGFALTSLWLREASIHLENTFMVNAALTLVYMVILQSIICAIWVTINNISQWRILSRHLGLAIFVGVTSAAGSIGWFTAMTYENAALVKSLGQVEIFITIAITYRIFKEKINLFEYIGMAFILASVLILLAVA